MRHFATMALAVGLFGGAASANTFVFDHLLDTSGSITGTNAETFDNTFFGAMVSPTVSLVSSSATSVEYAYDITLGFEAGTTVGAGNPLRGAFTVQVINPKTSVDPGGVINFTMAVLMSYDSGQGTYSNSTPVDLITEVFDIDPIGALFAPPTLPLAMAANEIRFDFTGVELYLNGDPLSGSTLTLDGSFTLLPSPGPLGLLACAGLCGVRRRR